VSDYYRRYVYGVGIDEPLVQITRTGQKFYYDADALGSIVGNEGHASGFLQRMTYGLFGETTTEGINEAFGIPPRRSVVRVHKSAPSMPGTSRPT
jgi:hypothetical protein